MRTNHYERKTGDEPSALIESINKAFHEFKAANDARLAALEKGRGDVLDEEKVGRLESNITALTAQLKAAQTNLEALEKKTLRPKGGGAESEASPEEREYKSALFGFLRSGDESGLRGMERKALQSSVNPDGGYTVLPEMDTAIDRVSRTTIAMRSLAEVRTIGTRSYKKLVTTSGAAVGGWGNERTAPSETNTPSMVELEFTPGTLWAEPRATQEILEDSDVNMEAWLTEEVGITFQEQENDGFLNGSGVDRPRGLLTYNNVANASYSWGNVGYIASGADGAFAASNPSDKLVELQHSLKTVYRAGATWLMSDATLGAIRRFRDGQGIYLWAPSNLEGGPSGRLLGHPVVTDDHMPAIASNSFSIALGDFRRAYVIVDRRGTSILRDALTSKPHVKFYTTRRTGGGIKNFEAVKLMKFQTS